MFITNHVQTDTHLPAVNLKKCGKDLEIQLLVIWFLYHEKNVSGCTKKDKQRPEFRLDFIKAAVRTEKFGTN